MRMLSPVTLSRWPRPTGALASSLWDDFFQDLEPTASSTEFSLHYDVKETSEHFLLSFDLPGVKKEDLSIKVKDNSLVLTGERRRENLSDENQNTVWHGRSFGRFERVFSLPNTVNLEKIEAHHQDGVLNLVIPKVAEPKGRDIEIQSGETGIFGKLFGARQKTSDSRVVDVDAS